VAENLIAGTTAMAPSDRKWHIEAITPEAEKAVSCLAPLDFIDSFYLAGGTALALYFGHRLSADLDFFAPSFQEEEILGRLQLQQRLSVLSKGRETLHILIVEGKDTHRKMWTGTMTGTMGVQILQILGEECPEGAGDRINLRRKP
jgi:hypothetical protein